jgi:cytochrome c biogenesis protein
MLNTARVHRPLFDAPPLAARCTTALATGLRILTSMRLALAVLLSLAALTALGTIIEQAPAVGSDQAAHAQWLAQTRARYGPATGVFNSLSLFDLFHSLLFRSLVALLAASSVTCTARRWRAIWNAAFRPTVRPAEGFFLRGQHRAALASDLALDAAVGVVAGELASAGYRVTVDRSGPEVVLMADRHRLSRFGTVGTHLGLVLILGGAMVGGVWGAQNPALIVSEGDLVPLGLNTHLSIRLDQFSDQYTLSGVPSDLRSDVTVFDGGREAGTHSIRVNSPLRYKGVSVHQSFAGQSAVLRITDSHGSELFNGGVPLAWRRPGSDLPLGSLTLPGPGLVISLAGPGVIADDLVPAGEVRLEVYRAGSLVTAPQNLVVGVPANVGDVTFTFVREGRYVGFKVVKDPGLMVVWCGAALMLLGMIALFYFPPRRLWALCERAAEGGTRVRVAVAAQRDFALDSGFDQIRSRLEGALHVARRDMLARRGGKL